MKRSFPFKISLVNVKKSQFSAHLFTFTEVILKNEAYITWSEAIIMSAVLLPIDKAQSLFQILQGCDNNNKKESTPY